MVPRLARALALVAALLWLAPEAVAQVRILGQPGSHPTIQAAIDVASDGDVVVVEDGLQYAGFHVPDKALTVLAQNAGSVAVFGACEIQGLSADRTVALVDLILRCPNGPALALDDCAGQILIQECTLRGGTSGGVHAGLAASNCQKILLERSQVLGSAYGNAPGGSPQPGGAALWSLDSLVIAYHSTLKGGEGSNGTYPSGGTGGMGARVKGWGLFVAGTTLEGGAGGAGDSLGCTTSGNGGDGLALDAAQVSFLDDARFVGGQPGSFSTCSSGVPGLSLVLSPDSSTHRLPGLTRELDGPAWTFESSPSFYKVLGQPGDAVWLLRAPAGRWKFLPGLCGWAALAGPWKAPLAPVGVIGPSGVLVFPLEFPDLSGTVVNSIWSMQTLCVNPSGKASLSAPHHLVLVNT